MYEDLLDNRIALICEYEYMNFLCKKNVVGIALGYKKIKGYYTNEKCITVFVVQKVPTIELDSDDVIPILYKGIKTDVIKSGIFSYDQPNNCISTKQSEVFSDGELVAKVRPTIGGYSIGTAIDPSVGTLGCLVADSVGGIYILSNNHVLADLNKNPIGTHIIQPAIYDKGNIKTDLVAVLSKFIPLKFASIFSPAPKNYVDCAIAKVLSKTLVSSEIFGIGIPEGISIPILKKSVKKAGRTTGLTTGSIIGINATTYIGREKPCLFAKQIIAEIKGGCGDSGSILIDDNNNAVGLFAGEGDDINTIVCNPITRVLKELNVRLVTP